MDDEGQVSLEAVLIMGVAILIILSLFNIMWARMSLAKDVGEAGEAKMTGILLAEGINNVYANGVNFSITLTDEEIDYTILSLPIVIDTTERKINITANLDETGGGSWTTTVSIIPSEIVREDSTSRYPETTIRSNGTHVIIHANSSKLSVV